MWLPEAVSAADLGALDDGGRETVVKVAVDVLAWELLRDRVIEHHAGHSFRSTHECIIWVEVHRQTIWYTNRVRSVWCDHMPFKIMCVVHRSAIWVRISIEGARFASAACLLVDGHSSKFCRVIRAHKLEGHPIIAIFEHVAVEGGTRTPASILEVLAVGML